MSDFSLPATNVGACTPPLHHATEEIHQSHLYEAHERFLLASLLPYDKCQRISYTVFQFGCKGYFKLEKLSGFHDYQNMMNFLLKLLVNFLQKQPRNGWFLNNWNKTHFGITRRYVVKPFLGKTTSFQVLPSKFILRGSILVNWSKWWKLHDITFKLYFKIKFLKKQSIVLKISIRRKTLLWIIEKTSWSLENTELFYEMVLRKATGCF